jgi:serine/threonine-protein kinase
VKLVDCGVASSRWRRVDPRALPHRGTVAYSSPEQCRGEVLDRRSDVYALGIMLWELATWQRVYGRMAPEQILARVAIGAVPRPSQVRADIPGELEDLIMTALHPVPSRRFSNTAAVANALRQLAGATDASALATWTRRLFR